MGLSPETYRAKAFAKNKPQLLHLVGIIFTTEDWTTILAAAENGKVEVLSELLKQRALVTLQLKHLREFQT